MTCPNPKEFHQYWFNLFSGKGIHYTSIITYYTSPSLGKFLLENKTHLCGTIRSNWQNYLKELVNNQLDKGDAAFFLCENPKMVACKYHASKDKASGKQKVVYMLSTCHQPNMTDIMIGGQPGRKPICVKYYNHRMGAVNKVNQQLHYQHTLWENYTNGIASLHFGWSLKSFWLHLKFIWHILEVI